METREDNLGLRRIWEGRKEEEDVEEKEEEEEE